MDVLSPRNSMKSSPDSSECMSDGMLKCPRVVAAADSVGGSSVCLILPSIIQVLKRLAERARCDRGGISPRCVFCASFTHMDSVSKSVLNLNTAVTRRLQHRHCFVYLLLLSTVLRKHPCDEPSPTVPPRVRL